MTSTLQTVAVAGIVAASMAAQSSSSPQKRAHHALVYDAASKRVLLIGGSTPTDDGRSGVTFDDMWAFDGARWTPVAARGERLSSMRVILDRDRGRLVSLGGYDGRSSIGSLRVFENGEWRTVGAHPGGAAAEAGFVYDSRRHRLVAFGGSSGPGQVLGDTWTYADGKWSKLAGEGPSPRQAHVMAYDERRGRVVVFGGYGPSAVGQRPQAIGDLWELDGDRWIKRDVTPGPASRGAAGVAYDTRRGLTIVFGGSAADGFTNDTWAWDGTAWKKLSETGPERRAMGYLAYDEARDRVVLFGGRKGWPNDLDDTWEWDATAWRQVGGA